MTPESIDDALQQAATLHEAGQSAQAESAYRNILLASPDHPDALYLLGLLLAQTDRLPRGLELVTQAIAIDPEVAEYHCAQGEFYRQLGSLDDAIAALNRAIAIDNDYYPAHFYLGMAMTQKGNFANAVTAFSRATQLHPDDALAWQRLGNALKDNHQIDEAIAAHANAIRLQPANASLYVSSSVALRMEGLLDEAIAALLKALEIQPASADASNNLANLYKEQGRLDDAIQCLRAALKVDPNSVLTRTNLVYSIYFHPDYDSASILKENQEWARRHAQPLAREIRPHANDHSPDRPLKIGYVSPDFRSHPAASFLLPLLASHDPRAVDVHCYAGVKRPDEITQRLQKLSPHWQSTLHLSDAQLAEQIRADGIDILIDLSMHMSDNRLLTFARKPAPVQITWLAYPGTTGLSTIDYRLTDPFLDPPGKGDEFYSEQSIRLPHCFWCYEPMIPAAPANPLPALNGRRFTFGCLNHLAKVTQPTLGLWVKIMRLPESRLLMMSMPGSHLDRLRKIFADSGIAPNRLNFVDRHNQPEYFQLYHHIDLCLDPIPYPGHTSAMDALWMGIPSVTLAGRTAASRGGESILSNIRLPQFIARTPEEYVSIATTTATDLPSLATLRTNLRQRMAASPLMDARRFAKEMETAFHQMWRRWCATSSQ